MNEIISKRTPNIKYFKKEKGIIEARVYGTNIHYLKNGKYEEIKNKLIEKDNSLINEENSYKTIINKDNASIRYEQDNYYLELVPIINENIKFEIEKNTDDYSKVRFYNILENTDLEYELTNIKVKEEIIINSSIEYESLSYNIKTNLNLKIDKEELIASKNKKTIFKFLVPFIYDSNNEYGKVNYELKDDNLIINIDKKWINNKKRKYPIILDPTLINESNQLDDTYIYNGDTNDTRYNRNYIIAGVEKINNVDRANRSLLKFLLPTLGTGEEIISAELWLSSWPGTDTEREMTEEEYRANTDKLIEIHKLTSNWTLSGANWNNMNNQFSSEIEAVGYVTRSYYLYNPDESRYELVVQGSMTSMLITDLVKKWYKNEPNYGIMIKQANESYINEMYPKFFSSNCGRTELIPSLIIRYRNQSGIEGYWDYSTQSFVDGASLVNNYNGNLVTKFNLASTLGVFPASIGIVYNTNDVTLNHNTVYGKGYKLTLDETIKEVTIDEQDLLEYIDGDGTIHYFYKNNDDNKYYDEDGLSLTGIKENTIITINDKNGNNSRYTKNGDYYYLDKIKDVDNREINITRDSNNYITKIVDGSNEEINITYTSNQITISSPKESSILNLTNNNLSSIVTISGTTSFTYDSNNLISGITDVNGKKIEYEYYTNTPYRIKKVKEYGTDNTIGEYFEIDYGLKTTTITDNKGRITTNIFNNFGNLLSRNSMTPTANLKEAYSIGNKYGDELSDTNKLLTNTVPIKYTNNIFGPTNYSNMNNVLELSSNMSLVNDRGDFDGACAVKLVSTSSNQTATYHEQISGSTTKTTSLYLKTDGSVKIGFYEYELGTPLYEKTLSSSNDFEKIIYTNYTDDFYIEITNITACTTYVGDLQIEEGETSNDVNIVSNSDFSDGTNGWTLEAESYETGLPVSNIFEVTTIDNHGNKALKVKMKSENRNVVTKDIEVIGFEDDLFYLSFWYKNEGLEIEGGSGIGAYMGNTVSVWFEPQVGEIEQCVPDYQLNSNKETWQYFSMPFAPIKDYKKITIMLNQGRDSGNLYITNFALYKSLKTREFTYDENGNVINTTENYENNIFNYDKNNELISGANVRGRNFKIEYDNNHTERVIRATSSDGLSNKLSYDTYGNPTKIKVSHDYNDSFITDYYKIRLKGTNDYLNILNGELKFKEDYCSNTIFKVTITNDELKVSDSMFENRYFNIINNNLVLSNSELLFKYELNNNGSYHIYLYEEEVIPGEGSIVHYKYLKQDNNCVILIDNPDDIVDNYLYEFYFEKATSLFIETNSEYTSDGRFLTSVTDSLFNKTLYNRDSVKGLLTKVIDAKDNEIEYTYNNKNQITKIKQGNKEVNYGYNSNNNFLNTISQDDKVYSFLYDNFLNVTSIKVNNRTLITNTYENNNGNLISATYGNGNVITYTYDNFDRVKTITKTNNNVTEYFYNNNGNVSKIKENDVDVIFDYDINKRIKKYQKEDFIISYKYDLDNNVINKKYNYQSNSSEVENVFNKDGMVLSSTVDNLLINYSYDELNRLSSKITSNNIITNYDFYYIGKRTSNLIKSITNGNNTYKYNYDKLYNITDIYYNNNLINHYEYDDYNELLSDIDYINNFKYEYTYNSAGNITSKVKKDRLTNNVISTDTYSYNNSTWEDLLTSYNNESITYDEIGNPTVIGTKVLTWVDGRKLNSYTAGNLSVTYKYNNDGIRIEKIVNNISTKYILEGNKIIYENRNGNILYYYYDNSGVFGVKYNNINYFFIKNVQGDITCIVDSNNNTIVKYEYDSFGNILSIKDNNDNIITDATNIGLINPFRYRGYYYDSETNFYYLNTRYYNPLWGRFINADGIIGSNHTLISQNLYLYCDNNYINNIDQDGDGFWAIVATIAIGGAIAAGAKVVTNLVNGDDAFKDVGAAFLGGMVGTATFLLTKNVMIGSVAGALTESLAVETHNNIELSKKKPNDNQCSMLNETTIARSGQRIIKNTIINGLSGGIIGDSLDILNPSSKVILSLPSKDSSYFTSNYFIENGLELVSSLDFNNIISYNKTPQSTYINPYFSSNEKYLIIRKKQIKIVESSDGYCIASWE